MTEQHGHGDNGEGQLGNGTADWDAHPVAAKLESFTSETIVCAGSHSMAVKEDGSVWAWGNNGQGQLGDETIINRNYKTIVHFPIDKNNNGVADWHDFLFADNDKDGLLDADEIIVTGTDPQNFDSNSDGLADGINVFTGLPPKGSNTDGDGISNVSIRYNNSLFPVELSVFDMDDLNHHYPDSRLMELKHQEQSK